MMMGVQEEDARAQIKLMVAKQIQIMSVGCFSNAGWLAAVKMA